MKIATLLLCCCITSLVLADEFPYTSSTKVTPKTTPVNIKREILRPPTNVQPVWKGLERMDQAQKENSRIELILEENASDAAKQMARNIENLWNSAKFDEALALFHDLSTLTDLDKVAIGNSWRTPVATGTERWGNDVRIGNRDSVLVTAFDIHRASGNLFAVLLLQGDGYPNLWCVYHSTNGGATWNETYLWWASYQLNSLSAAVVQNHCYVGFGRGPGQDQAFLYRFRADNGHQQNFSDGSSFHTVFTTSAPDSIKEVSLSSNQDYYNNRLYYCAIINDGTLRFFWGLDTTFISYTEITTNVTDADRGLDISSDERFSSRYEWISYINSNDTLKIDAVHSGDTWDRVFSYPVGTSTDFSSISAYGDTITGFFDYHGNVVHCRYLVTYDGGTSWFYGWVDDTSTTHESPSITARAGGGLGAVYRFYTPTRQGRYAWRYYRGGWNAPETYTDIEPYYNRPSIEYLGNNNFGVVYLSWRSPVTRGAYFDRSDWVTGVVEQPPPGSITDNYVLFQNYPNPFNPNTTIQFYVAQRSLVTMDIYDNLGQRVRRLVDGVSYSSGPHSVEWDGKTEFGKIAPSGVYFYKMKATNFQQVKKMLLLK